MGHKPCWHSRLGQQSASEAKGATDTNMENFDDDFGAPPPADVDPAAEFLAKEQEELGEIGEDLGLAPPQEISAFKEESDFTSNDLQDTEGISSGMSNLNIEREEPEFLKKWKVEQEERLKKKDEDEEVMKEKLRLQARQELEDWYTRYEAQLEKTKSTNREVESDFVAEVGGMNHIEPGSEWERVSKHCDFSAKAPGHTKDVSRMRSILP